MAGSVFETLSSGSVEPVSEAGAMESMNMANLQSGNSADSTSVPVVNDEPENVGVPGDEMKAPDDRPRLDGGGDGKTESLSLSPTEEKNGLQHHSLAAQYAESIRRLHKRSISDIVEIGRLLSECKKLLGHGNWLPWLEREFAWSERTARHYMTVYAFFSSGSANVTDFAMDLSTLYTIAAESTPPEARAEVMSRVGSGEVLSRREVRLVVQQAKQRQSITPRAPPRRSVKEVLDRSGFAVCRRLSPIEREITFALAKLEGKEIGIEWAEERAKLKRKHRDVLIVLDLVKACAKVPVRRIVAAVPEEQRSRTAEQLRRATEFLSDLASRLTD